MNDQIVQRQKRYNATRVEAGQASDGYGSPVWPVYKPAKLTDREIDEMIFKEDKKDNEE